MSDLILTVIFAVIPLFAGIAIGFTIGKDKAIADRDRNDKHPATAALALVKRLRSEEALRAYLRDEGS